jgi:translation elongation factor EF-1alpha
MSKHRVKNVAYDPEDEESVFSSSSSFFSDDDYVAPKAKTKANAKPQPKAPVLASKPKAVPVQMLEAVPEGNERSRQLVVVICGHVDSGKSSTTARLLQLAESGNRSSSDDLAHMCDESVEERERGLTINAAVKQIVLDGDLKLTIVDAPGHAQFVPAMIKGASLADAALLIVDATDPDTGLAPTGQAREHLRLISSYGIRRFAVVLNKVDRLRTLCDGDAALEGRLVKTEKAIEGIIAEETGDVAFLEFVRISAVTNENIGRRADPNLPCLVDMLLVLAQSTTSSRVDPPRGGADLRVPVLEKIGKTLSGRVLGTRGSVSRGTRLRVLPQFGEKPVFVKISERNFPTAWPGDFLGNVQVEEFGTKEQLQQYEALFASGSVVLVPEGEHVCQSAWKFVAEISVFNKSSVSVGDEMIFPGRQFVLHCGPAAQPVIVTQIIEASVTKKRLAGGDRGLVEFETLNIPLVVVPRESKIVLRYRGCTISRGLVLEVTK